MIIKCYLINNVFINFNLLGAEPECGPTFGPHRDILTDPGPVSDGLYLFISSVSEGDVRSSESDHWSLITDQWVVHQVALSLLFHFLLFRFDQNIWSHSQFSVLLIYLLLIWLWIDVHVWFLLYLSFSEFVFFQEFVYWFSVSVSDVDRLGFLLVFPRLLQHTIISCYGNQRQTR